MTAARRGDLLVASPFLLDPNFRRSVVLLCDHGEDGSLGLVVNRPMKVPLGAVMERFKEHPLGEQLVHQGGPVEPGRLLGIRRGEDPEERAEPLAGDLHLLIDLEYSLDRIADGTVDGGDYRFFLGYSGWGKGQLRSELGEDAWIIAKATTRLAFEVPTPELWSESLMELGGVYELFAQMPIDPEQN
jgi:putative transcriptional regulator